MTGKNLRQFKSLYSNNENLNQLIQDREVRSIRAIEESRFDATYSDFEEYLKNRS